MSELDIQKILDALREEDVEFLVIGGVAVGFHGYVRATKDIDIVPSPNNGNLGRLARVLDRLDAEVEGAEEFEGEELPNPLDPEALALGGNWVLSTKFGRFDVMQWLGEEELWAKLSPTALTTEIGGIAVKMVDYESLVALKRQAGRPEDLADLQRLRQARGESS
ncbi:MAG TPA: hypothetical protein VFY04_06160 [Solirubrobacterales bacterium]|nr:hypothetical protein [Solirubrobacterales bacterium]